MSWQLWPSLGVVIFLSIHQNQCFGDLAESAAEAVVGEPTEAVVGEPAEAVVGEPAEAVVTLTTDNFDTVINGEATVLVEFYAPWCGHCKNFAPIYEKAAQKLKDREESTEFDKDEPKIILAKVDGTAETALKERYSIQGYPTLKFFKKGIVYDYEGERDVVSITNIMQEVAQPDWKPPPDPVLTLTNANFDHHISTNPLILVEFYAPWCGHCKRLAPKYEKAAQILQKQDPSIPIAKVDADEEKELKKRFGITGFPTLKVFRHGKAYNYTGARETNAIVDKMISYLKPAVTLIESEMALNNFISYTEPRIVGFFQGIKLENDGSAPTATLLARAFFDSAIAFLDDFQFGYVNSREQFGYSKDEVVIYHPTRIKNDFEDSSCRFEGEPNVEALGAFYREKSSSLVSVLMEPEKTTNPDHIRVQVYFDIDFSVANNNQHKVRETMYWYTRILKVAKEFEKNQNVVFRAADASGFTQEIKEMGLDKNSDDISVGIWHGKSKYPLKGDFSDLKQLIEDVLAGKAKPFLKSAKKPKSNKGPVKIVVGKTFKKIVNQKKNDVFIEFYAPWCGHCKSVAPTWKSLGKLFKGEKRIVIAKMDAVANDVPSPYEVSGFPTFYFKKAKQAPVKYSGGREKLDFIRYLHNHSTYPITTVPEPPPPEPDVIFHEEPTPDDKEPDIFSDKEEL